MSGQHDPMRLLELGDSAFAELDDGLRDARRQGPSTEQLARMRAALGLPPPSGGEPGGDAPAPRPSAGEHTPNEPSSAGASLLLRLVVSGALAIGAVLGIYLVRDRSEPTPPPAERLLPAAQRPPAQAGSATAAPAASASPLPEPSAVKAARKPRRSAEVQDPDAEIVLLKRARAHARSGPTQALALLAQHEQRFAHGVLEQEREVIAVEALLASGLREQAERRAAAFLERFPASAHTRRIRALLSERWPPADSDTKQTAHPHSTH